MEVLSLGSEPVLGTFGSAGGVAATNVGVHGGETKDASTDVIASIVEGESKIAIRDESDPLHRYSTA